MVFIELDIENSVEQSDNLIAEMIADTECFKILWDTGLKVSNNYYDQSEKLATIMKNQMIKVEKELFKKWNLDGGIYINDADFGSGFVTSILYPTLIKNYTEAKDMLEVNNDEVLDNSKSEIVNYFYEKLDEYAKEYEIEDGLIGSVKKDVADMVSKYFDSAIDLVLNDNVKNKLLNLSNSWEKAYEKLDYEKMNNISKKIMNLLQKNNCLYRDEDLEKSLEEIITKNQFIQNKLSKGEEGKLNDIEEIVILRYLNSENLEEDNDKNRFVDFIEKLENRAK